MILITCIVLVLVKLCLGDDDCVIQATSTEILWEKKLKNDLSCGMNIYIAPKPPNSEPLSVKTKFILKYFTFSSDEEVLSMHTWLFISWTDTRLQWDPEKYGGLEEIELSSSRIWTPSLRLFNSADSHDFDRFFYVICNVKNTGLVLCVPRMMINARCSVKLKKFPYDAQECTLEFGPWGTISHSFNLNVTSRAISMWGADYGSQWFISDYKQKVQLNTDSQLNMTFVLEREALSLAAVVVYPALVITGLTIICLFLDVKQELRLGLICFSIFSHYYWLSELGVNIPKESVDPPNLLLYYRGSLVLTVFLLVISFVLSVISKKHTAPYNIVISINAFVYTSYLKFLIFPQWDDMCFDETDENKNNEDWIKFSNNVNSVCNIIILIAYMAMYFTLIPQPIPIQY